MRIVVLEAELARLQERLPTNRVNPNRPNPVTFRIPEDAHRMGSKGARVVLVEFEDLECPYCKRFFTSKFQEIKQKYIDSDEAAFVVIEFPLSIHMHARQASRALLCSDEQGKFWQYRAALLETDHPLDDTTLSSLARIVGIDPVQLEGCELKQQSSNSAHRHDDNYGNLGIRATPTFVVGVESNGVITGEVLSEEGPQTALDRTIRAKRQ